MNNDLILNGPFCEKCGSKLKYKNHKDGWMCSNNECELSSLDVLAEMTINTLIKFFSGD